MATETLEQTCKPALFTPLTEEVKEVFLAFWCAPRELGLKVSYFPSEVEKRPILLVDDERYTGGAEILHWLD